MDVSIWSLFVTHTLVPCFVHSVLKCLLWGCVRCMWTMSGWPVSGKEAASVSWPSSTGPQEQPQSEPRPTWSCGVSTETAIGEYLWWAGQRAKEKLKSARFFLRGFPVVLVLNLHFSIGKHFEKEENVRGIPQESVHFRWDDLHLYV